MATYTVTAICGGETATATVTVPHAAILDVQVSTPSPDADPLYAVLLATGYSATTSDTYTIDWGDNTTPDTGTVTAPNAIAGDHTYTNAGTYRVVVTTGNGDAGTGSVTVTAPVAVKLSAPTALASTGITETGFGVTFTASANASGYTATASPGSLTGTVTGTTATFTSATPGVEYTASIIANGDGTSYTDSDPATLKVTTTDYTSPTVAIDVGSDPDATANITTVDDADDTVSIDWGDGSDPDTGVTVTSNAATGTHTYASNDTFTVTVTGDNSGKSGTASATIAGA